MSYVAFQYAEALFTLAVEEQELDAVAIAFDQFIKLKDEFFRKR